MSAQKPKFFIANRHTNHISHRKLSGFEEKNPRMFGLSHAAFQYWDDAHAWLLSVCAEQVKSAEKDLAARRRRLVKAEKMSKPVTP